jgi:addiction module HigA family antidote
MGENLWRVGTRPSGGSTLILYVECRDCGLSLGGSRGANGNHPGEHLAGELKALEMSAAELARKISVPTNRVTQILNGTRSITGDTALRLAHFFGTSPQFWLNLQTLYDVRIAEQKPEKQSVRFQNSSAKSSCTPERTNPANSCPSPEYSVSSTAVAYETRTPSANHR